MSICLSIGVHTRRNFRTKWIWYVSIFSLQMGGNLTILTMGRSTGDRKLQSQYLWLLGGFFLKGFYGKCWTILQWEDPTNSVSHVGIGTVSYWECLLQQLPSISGKEFENDWWWSTLRSSKAVALQTLTYCNFLANSKVHCHKLILTTKVESGSNRTIQQLSWTEIVRKYFMSPDVQSYYIIMSKYDINNYSAVMQR